jgi:hypothetical protein
MSTVGPADPEARGFNTTVTPSCQAVGDWMGDWGGLSVRGVGSDISITHAFDKQRLLFE